MSTTTQNRLAQLREILKSENLDALIVPTTDEYLSEYVAPHNQRLAWLTGFTGSAGTAIITQKKAAIFVDGRYRVQVKQQVDQYSYDYCRYPEDPMEEWLSAALTANSRIGMDTRIHSYSQYQNLDKVLTAENLHLVATRGNLIDRIWQDRPAPEVKSVLLMNQKWTGESSESKRQRLAMDIQKKRADAAILFAPDSINWLLNIRGRDVPCLPVVLSVAILRHDGSMQCFLDTQKLTAEASGHCGPGVTFKQESEFKSHLAALSGYTVMADMMTCSADIILSLKNHKTRIIDTPDPVQLAKATKSSTELAGMAEAHYQDAAAMVNFLSWFDAITTQGERPDEETLAAKAFFFRQQQPDFVELSFDTISASGSNAAMCHYNHRNNTPAVLPENGVYLIDSGGQYYCGTTDITRTLAVGQVSAEIKQHFTLVLKGHIALSSCRFPVGTTGPQLDVLARYPLWQNGLDFEHGTGHGVGHFLNVHEGPQRIGKKSNNTALQPGMVVSNEPGYYKENAYGIRCENLVVVKNTAESGPDGLPFLQFDNLTWVPFDRRLIEQTLLTTAEIQWINSYHSQVRELISNRVDTSARQWLSQATQPL